MQAQIVVQSQGRRGSFMFPPSLVPNIKKKKKPTWWEWSWALGHSPNALALQHGCGSRQMPRCQNREAAPKVIDLGTRALAQSPSALAAQHIEKKTQWHSFYSVLAIWLGLQYWVLRKDPFGCLCIKPIFLCNFVATYV